MKIQVKRYIVSRDREPSRKKKGGGTTRSRPSRDCWGPACLAWGWEPRSYPRHQVSSTSMWRTSVGVPATRVGPHEQALVATTRWQDLKGNPSAQSCSHCPWGSPGSRKPRQNDGHPPALPPSQGPKEGWSRLPSRLPLPRDVQSPHLPVAWLRTAQRESP